MKHICIIGISGKLGRYMLQHALARGYTVSGVCRPESVHKLDEWKDKITVYPGRTDDHAAVSKAVEGADAVLTVLAPWGVKGYSTNTASAVMKYAKPDARLVFSCGWHITRDGQDVYSWKLRAILAILMPIVKFFRLVDINDQYRACDMIFNSGRDWTVVRGCNLEEGESEGLPVWSEHVGDPILASNLVRRTDFALFMVDAIDRPELSQQAPAIVGCKSESVLAHQGQAAMA
ncbi:NAD(P)-dependent oxidoreductase [Pseudoprimorskyibacter insulae]|uniref:NAD(P)-binding domain-containing protein n=1 Tax=Pseudoprimorskyibacter insulae TaxID=1695997 RepID=A0A2R8APG1_9RHOB|nr:NAD(P)H-binding protein [Pseudoprimorskyibacter insulae]SPF77952.1 hypothetical protein PRI8871_00540 [Pseudoprimorskyibacter insulae]